MKIDKFGIGSLVVGVLIVLGMLQFFFMDKGWNMAGLIDAVIVTVQGGVILLGLFLVVIGILLLWL